MWRTALAALCLAAPAAAQEIVSAEYVRPTTEYPHGVLGDAVEWKAVRIEVTRTAGREGGLFSGSTTLTYDFVASDGFVFEDTAPRLWDVTGDGKPEVVVVQTQVDQGARLLVIGLDGGKPAAIAATPHIGTRFRWLAPAGAADFDGDGHVEVAFVDRPHLARTLRVWRYTGDRFFEIATLPGVTNHRIGDDTILGGTRDCGQGPELVLADAGWQWIMAARLTATTFNAARVAPLTGPDAVAAALACN